MPEPGRDDSMSVLWISQVNQAGACWEIGCLKSQEMVALKVHLNQLETSTPSGLDREEYPAIFIKHWKTRFYFQHPILCSRVFHSNSNQSEITDRTGHKRHSVVLKAALYSNFSNCKHFPLNPFFSLWNHGLCHVSAHLATTTSGLSHWPFRACCHHVPPHLIISWPTEFRNRNRVSS